MINTAKYQTVVLPKKQIDEVKKLARSTRMPMTKVISFAIDELLSNPDVQRKYKESVRVA